MGRVKEKTLRRIEDFFARETALRGSAEIQVTLEDLRRETQLSLVTIYKALDNLVELGKLEVVDQGNRRSPKVYRYIFAHDNEGGTVSVNSDLGGLTKTLDDLLRQLAVKEQVIEALRQRLSDFENQESNVLYRLRVSEDVEVIVRRKK